MRPIKFRYWNTLSNIMVNDPVVPTMKKVEWSLDQYFSERGWVWMQFTGLHDKNGKEIYEGDVVRITNGTLLTIEWRNGGFFLCTRGMNPIPLHEFVNVIGHIIGKVIGNIYENPDLIK